MPRPDWHKGMESPNPSGKPKGRLAFAREIGEVTKNGLLMLQTCVRIALGQDLDATPSDKLQACRLLLEYWIGKPAQDINLGVTVRPNLAALSTEELEQLRAIATKALPEAEKATG